MGVKINELSTEASPVGTDLVVIADPTTGVASKITLSALKTALDAIGGDTTPPTVVSATVENANPNQVVVVFSESVTVTTAGWSFRRNTTNWAVSSVAGSGTTWTFTMATSAASGETIDRSYNPATGATVDGAANELGSFTNASVTNNVGGSFDSDAQAYFTAVEGGGYTFATGEKNAINTFVVGLKADSLWTPCVALYPMIGSTYGSMKWNLKNPLNTDGAYRLEEIGTPLYTANGAKCEVGEALNTNFELSGLIVSGNAIGIYIRDNANGNYYDMGGNGSSSPVVQLIARNSDTAFSDNPNSGGTGRISTANTNSTRLFIQTRQSATSHKLFRDGTQLGTTNTNDVTGETYPTAQLWIGASNNNGSAQEGNKEFCFAFISTSGFSDTDVANMTSRVNTLVTALGRNV